MVREVVALAGAMRAGGARVGTGEVETAARALGVVGASRTDAYLALRAIMCSRREDLAVFDEAFAQVFAGGERVPPPFEMPPGVELALPRVADPGAAPAAGQEPAPGEPEVRPAAWSQIELLLDKDFSEYSEAERALARAVVERVVEAVARRRAAELYKLPGVGETIAWAQALGALGPDG
ncbi:MAG: hypothetical protein ACXVFK_19350, partial [Solirubrobacteraceae bacterium]